jgi:hypothetical protein
MSAIPYSFLNGRIIPWSRRISGMIDRQDFNNTWRSLRLRPIAHKDKPLEDRLYGAAVDLIHWRQLNLIERQEWFRNNLEGQIGAYWGPSLNLLCWRAYGKWPFDNPVTTEHTFQPISVEFYPWTLMDDEFKYCMRCLETDNLPDRDKLRKDFLSESAKIPEVMVDTVWKKATHKLGKFVRTAGGHAVEKIWKIKNVTRGGVAIDVLREILKDKSTRAYLQTVRSFYRVDEVRRTYLASIGQSAYRVDFPARLPTHNGESAVGDFLGRGNDPR